MAEVRLLDSAEQQIGHGEQQAAIDLARRLPALVVAAREVASSLMHGMHGRRRAGLGETFWQFRPFVSGESTSQIDWRRSARDEHIYVREREWEAAHSVWIWMDRSVSMAFTSTLALQSKLERAIVLGFAAADLLVRGGERVGALGLTPPLATRTIIERFAEAILVSDRTRTDAPEELPQAAPLAPRTRAVLLSDFLSDPDDIARTVNAMSARGAKGHLVMIADPVEETFPFRGHTEFMDVDSTATLRVGQAESFSEDYIRRLAAHRDAVAEVARKRGWTFALHRTDRPASEALLALRTRLESGAETGRAN
ncbi:DUF58 domain-containing protein [Methyloferula stellata]|uniref:DUF58 domain-containing protein n=1 Tax=Methyloferula stellata TaxID=876270 RepID=UPI00035D5CC4|nr:DUF58 domain-containing protein [Methyloferula stellata]